MKVKQLKEKVMTYLLLYRFEMNQKFMRMFKLEISPKISNTRPENQKLNNKEMNNDDNICRSQPTAPPTKVNHQESDENKYPCLFYKPF